MKPQDLLIQKKILWAEIKAMERDYVRLQDAIDLIETDKKQILHRVKQKLDEVQRIGEELAEIEIEYLKKNDL
jgi:chromosome segregation ATPase